LRFLDRFTRDEVSAKIWWPLSLVAIVALVLTIPLGHGAADQVRADSAARAVAASRATIEPLTSRGATTEEMSAALAQLVANDPVWSTARVWSASKQVIASSRSEQLNTGARFNDDALAAAAANGTVTQVTDIGPNGDPGPTTFHAYAAVEAPIGSDVVEFETRDAALLADVHRVWLGYTIVAAVATALLLGLALLSMREPLAPIGINVPLYPESIPANQKLVGLEEAVAIEHAEGRVHDRITGLEQRLDESERLRLKAEGALQQALTALGAGARTMPVPRREPRTPTPAASPPAPTPAVSPPAPTPAVTPPIQAPTPAAAAPARRVPRRAAAPAPVSEPRTAAPAAPTPAPQTAAAKSPVAKPAPAKTPVRKVPPPAIERTTSAASAAPPAAEERAPAAKVEPPPAPARRQTSGKHVPSQPVTVAADDVSVTETPAAPSTAASSDAATQPESWPEVVVLPDPQPAKAGAPAAHGPDSDDAVLDVLHRLVPESETAAPLPDPGDLRARLARTAALKKPGSRERQGGRDASHEEPPQQ
jgi:hypothetical protein